MDFRAPIVQVAPWSCAQRMTPGQVRRWAVKGKSAFSYVVACPKCRRAISILAEDWGLEEGPLVTSKAALSSHPNAPLSPYEHPTSLRSTKVHLCHGCGGKIRAEGGVIVLEPPTATPR